MDSPPILLQVQSETVIYSTQTQESVTQESSDVQKLSEADAGNLSELQNPATERSSSGISDETEKVIHPFKLIKDKREMEEENMPEPSQEGVRRSIEVQKSTEIENDILPLLSTGETEEQMAKIWKKLPPSFSGFLTRHRCTLVKGIKVCE